MTCEIASMTISTSAALTIINGGIAVAVYPDDQGPIDTGVAMEAVVLVDGADGIAQVASNAEGGVGYRRQVVMTMAPGAPGEIVRAVTSGAICIRRDGVNPWPVAGQLEHRGRDGTDMTIATLIGMDRHRVVGRMTANTERGVEDMT
jgi:hypothetical protein